MSSFLDTFEEETEKILLARDYCRRSPHRLLKKRLVRIGQNLNRLLQVVTPSVVIAAKDKGSSKPAWQGERESEIRSNLFLNDFGG
jgi:hypothetical protein